MDGKDAIFGGAGKDALFGGNGDDWLDGGRARNTLTGGEGDDIFAFRKLGKPDTITDLSVGDQIALGFSGLGPSGPLDPDFFRIGSRAKTPDQHILYDSDTGWLLYAKNGSGTPDTEKFAKIGKGLEHLGADDFIVI